MSRFEPTQVHGQAFADRLGGLFGQAAHTREQQGARQPNRRVCIAGYAHHQTVPGQGHEPPLTQHLLGCRGDSAGVMHAPLTAIFLIAEITGGYGLFIPLIITSTIAYITIIYFEPHSIYTYRLARRGELITHHKDKAILTLLDMGKIIEKDFQKVSPDDKMEELIDIISKSKRNIFPVVNKDNMLVGIVYLDNIRHIIFNPEMYATTFVRDVMLLPPTYVSPDEPMEDVMKKFEENNVWNLPVIDNGKYIGFISKSKLFSVYRKWLVDISEE